MIVIEFLSTPGGLLLLVLAVVIVVIALFEGKPPWKNDPRGWT